MSEDKLDNIKFLDSEQSRNLKLIYESINEGIKPILENVALISNTYSEELNKTMKNIEIMGEQFNQFYKCMIESIEPILNAISNIKLPKLDIDFSEWKIFFYRTVFKEKEDSINVLYENMIFPPIAYLIKKNIKEINIKSCEEWILNDKELKLFYIENIERWKDKYSDDNIKRMIEEIKFNFEHGNSYSVCTLVAVIIEYMLKQNYSEKIKSKGSIYSSIRNVLNEKVFEPIGIDKLYIRFIEENLYASTDKAKEFSRHMTHGDKIEFGNMKSAMNMIFIYDFLQDVMILNELNS